MLFSVIKSPNSDINGRNIRYYAKNKVLYKVIPNLGMNIVTQEVNNKSSDKDIEILSFRELVVIFMMLT